jgi:hypothetical protein
MLAAMRQLFKQAARRKPIRLQRDKGKEFYNAQIRKFLRDQGVELFSTNSDHKAAIVERFNRTLKARIYKHFTAVNTRRYIDVLADMAHSYNHSRHRTIGRKPADVVTQKDGDAVWRRVYYDSKEAKLRRVDAHATKTGDVARMGGFARLSRWKGTFEKGYVPNWGREHFRVADMRPPRRGCIPRAVCKLKDMLSEDIQGACYPEEIQPVPEAASHTIEVEHILRQRRVGKHTEHLAKFKGWPYKFNRWLTKAELEQYQKPLRVQQEEQWKIPTSP